MTLCSTMMLFSGMMSSPSREAWVQSLSPSSRTASYMASASTSILLASSLPVADGDDWNDAIVAGEQLVRSGRVSGTALLPLGTW